MKTNNAATTNEMTKAEIAELEMMTAKGYVDCAREMIAAGTLFVKGVQIKAIHRANYKSIFTPGTDDMVRRYMGWPAITC